MGTLPSIGEVRRPWRADWVGQQWVVLLYIILIWGDFLLFLTDFRKWAVGDLCRQPRIGGDMRCIVGIVLGPAGPET